MVPSLSVCGSNLTGDTPFSCALRTAAGTFSAASPEGARGDLASLVAAICAAHGVAAADLRELRVDLGPGSYTGLRVAVTFVRFLQRSLDVPVLAVDSLAMLAAASAARHAGRLRPLLDARRQRFHCGTLQRQPDGRLLQLEEPRAMPLADIAATTRKGDRFVTTAAVAAATGPVLREAGGEFEVVARVTAADLFDELLPLRACRVEELEPRYLMGSYAEDAG